MRGPRSAVVVGAADPATPGSELNCEAPLPSALTRPVILGPDTRPNTLLLVGPTGPSSHTLDTHITSSALLGHVVGAPDPAN